MSSNEKANGELPRPPGTVTTSANGNAPPRPPLPPHAKGSAASPPPKTPPIIRDRSTSAGDESAVSALSAEENSSNENRGADRPVGGHQRKVSWGFAAKALAAGQTSDSVIFTPDLTSGSGVGAASPASSGSEQLSAPISLKPKPSLSPAPSVEGALRAGARQPGHVRGNTRITLEEVAASPLEDEAETAIIRALEERAWEEDHDQDLKFRRVLQTAKSARNVALDSAHIVPILANVPDEALRIVEEEEEKLAAEAEAEATGEAAGAPASSRRFEAGAGPSPAPSRGRLETEPSKRHVKKISKFEDVAGQLKNLHGASLGQREGGYLVKAAAAFKAKQSASHGGTNGPTGSYRDEAKTSTRADSSGDEEEEERVPISEADQMVQNMNRAYGLDDTFDAEAQVHGSGTAGAGAGASASKWGRVRLAVQTTSALRHAAEHGHEPTPQESGGEEGGGGGDEADGGTSPTNGADKKQAGLGYCGGMRCYRSLRNFKEIVQEICSLLQFRLFFKTVVGYVILPSVFISAILFYAAGNPIASHDHKDLNAASYSWWMLFAGARQICTFSLSKLTEIVIIDILILRTRWLVKILGSFVTLYFMQARGWPMMLTFWAVWDFALLFGNNKFAKHWLFYTKITWFMECNAETRNTGCNPAGDVVYSNMYFRVLIGAIVLGAATSMKRALVAMYQGKRSTEHYRPQLEKLMARMLLLSEVAHLALEIQEFYYGEGRAHYLGADNVGVDYKKLRGLKHVNSDTDDDDDEEEEEDSKSMSSARQSPPRSPASPNKSTRGSDVEIQADIMRLRKNTEDFTSKKSLFSQSMTSEAPTERPTLDHAQAHISFNETTRLKIAQLVGEWEEPTVMSGSKIKFISVQDVLKFRQAVVLLDQKHPFSLAFGPAKTRESCIDSAQNVYERLLMRTPDSELLPFDTLALIVLDNNGEIDETKARKLIRLFRPDRDGFLTALDFVKSCDKVYKEVRTLRAAIANSSQIDHAFEQIVNVFFYFVMFLIILTVLKVDAWTLFLSLSGFILSFAFMFGSAASKYFEGILLILVQHPFDIGDRIAISNPQQDTSPNGSSTWFVEAVSLFATTVRYATTNEVATYSNGSLAASRIINSNRSPKATVYIYNKFASDVPFEKVMVFKSVIESFVKERPRQWIAMSGFRATRVEADLGYIEYVIVLQHVEKWQNIGPILNSKAEVSSYCLEVQKKLGMKYEAPPLPVNLGMSRTVADGSVFEKDQIGDDGAATSSEPDFSALASLFTKPEEKKKK